MEEAQQQPLRRQIGIQKLVVFDGRSEHLNPPPIFPGTVVIIAGACAQALHHQSAGAPMPSLF